MSNLVQGVTFSLNSLNDFSHQALAIEIIQTMCDSPVNVRPTQFGEFEGVSRLANSAEPAKLLVASGEIFQAGGVVLSKGKDCEYQIQWNKSQPNIFPFISGHLMEHSYGRAPDVLLQFLSLVKRLALTTDAFYGDIRSMAFPGWDTPFNLHMRLPDIPNISLYGKPYIELFGRKKIESAPFHRIEKISNDIYWLQATHSVTEPVSDEIRLAIRSHLGEDAFMVGRKWRYKDGLHPEFGSQNH